MLCKYFNPMFFFACAKKNQKSTPENEYSPFSGKEVGLSFSTTVAWAWVNLLYAPKISQPDNQFPNCK
jgi:hypothetical protein